MEIVGPGKLPETGAAIGKAIHAFRHAVSGDLAKLAGGIDDGKEQLRHGLTEYGDYIQTAGRMHRRWFIRGRLPQPETRHV